MTMIATIMSRRALSLVSAVVALPLLAARAFTISNYDNVVSYWGQNSFGATNQSQPELFQQWVGYYCNDDAVDVFPIAFVDDFFSTDNLPTLNLANTCNNTLNSTFDGSTLPDCSALASDIEFCQSQGKILTISLGGAGSGVSFSDDDEATTFAQTIWDLFLGGSSDTRPFGSAVLDGVDLDIESGGSTGYATFVTELRSLMAGADKTYYISAAPQCPYPDANLGATINAVGFDMVYVQFYNNVCGLENYDEVQNWDFGTWDLWARTVSPNPDVKIYLGAPAASLAAGSGYVPESTLAEIATTMRNSFPSFGGVMFWDESQAYVNDRIDLAIKNALVASGSTGFTYPACNADAYISGNAYTDGEQTNYDGYVWEAAWWTDSTPSVDADSGWGIITACEGQGTVTAPSAGSCSGVAAWSSTTAYTGGEQVTYNGDLWTANWWTEGNTPEEGSAEWTEVGACTSSRSLPQSESGIKRRRSRLFRDVDAEF